MKDTRIKNDIKVMWHILNEGAPYDIEGKDVILYLITPFGKVKIDHFTIDKNVIHWTFFGKDQKTVGIYGLEMSINEDKEGMITTDKCKFVRLVAHSCMVGGADEGNVEADTIELTSNLELGNGSGGESSVFEAIYGETTHDEIVEQFNQGKICYLNSGSIQYILTLLNNSEVYFGAAYGNYHYYAVCSKPSRWYTQRKDLSHNIKDLDNGNVEIAIAGQTAEVVTPQNVGKQGVIRQTQTWTEAADKGYDYVMSNLVRGAIPQANIDLFTSAGAVFNEESGYFELNGLTDISYEEMINIHNYTIPFSVGVTAPQGVMLGRNLPIRTPYALKAKRYYIFSLGNWDYLFWDSRVERVKITEPITLGSLNAAFSLSDYLSDIDGVISLERASSTSGIFTNCWNLRSIQFTKLKASIEIKQSPRLTNASILYMIQNEIATSAIVITLHADAYARAMADTEIQAALEAHPNISLASA